MKLINFPLNLFYFSYEFKFGVNFVCSVVEESITLGRT